MGVEIERKFLVRGDAWGPGDDGRIQRQGYLAVNEECTVRVRISEEEASLTIKSAQRGLTRSEYEYPIPREEGEEMLARLCGLVIEKRRHLREFGGRTWEIDVFAGDNAGLVVAEVELENEQEEVELPPWVGKEVSQDLRYRVAYLSRHPYRDWRTESG